MQTDQQRAQDADRQTARQNHRQGGRKKESQRNRQTEEEARANSPPVIAPSSEELFGVCDLSLIRQRRKGLWWRRQRREQKRIYIIDRDGTSICLPRQVNKTRKLTLTQMVLFEQSICIRNMHNVHDSAVILDIVSI